MYRNITIFFSLFFQCFGPHRHLHSFPTRRSSDLPGAWEHDPAAADLMIFTVEKYAPLARKHGLDPDRKSTRLNSSHVAISYAVFCLKKKKNLNINASGMIEQKQRGYNEKL